MRARDLLVTAPITLRPDTPFLEIQHLFLKAQIGGAPVVDADGTVRGIVTSTDLLHAIDQLFDEDVDAEEPDGHAEQGGLVAQLEGLTAIEIATPEAIWVALDTPVSEIAQLMRREGVHRVLVGTDGKLAGLLTTFDVLKAVA